MKVTARSRKQQPALLASAILGLALCLVPGCDDGSPGHRPELDDTAGGKADDADNPCAGGYDPDASCQYDRDCTMREDCCPDLVNVCGSGEAQEFPGLPPDDGEPDPEDGVELYGIVGVVPCSELTEQPEPVEFISAVVDGPIDVVVSHPACGDDHEFVACFNKLPSYSDEEYVVDLTVYPGSGPCDGERETRVFIHPAALFEDYEGLTGSEADRLRVRLWRFGWLEVE